MPISLSEFKDKRGKKETIEYDTGDSIVFRWHPDRMTDEIYTAMMDAVSKPKETISPFEIGRSIIVPLVSEWDITDGGKPFAITEKNVSSLGLFICMDLVECIQAGVSEQITKKGSSTGS